MTTFNCTFEEFKQAAKEFHFAVPTLNRDELENAYKALVLMYFGMHEDMWQTSAATVLKMETKVYIDRVAELGD